MALLEYMERARMREQEVDEVKQMLARALGLIHPGHRSLRELAREAADRLDFVTSRGETFKEWS